MFPVINNKATGKRLHRIMKEHHITPKQVQNYLGLSCVQSVYHWLNGSSMPTIDNLYALSALFQIPMDDMICGTGKKNCVSLRQLEYRRLHAYYLKISELYAA